MRISIAMATYNGSEHLQEQLDSFLRQTRHPDELVVCDDGSSDDTLKILETFQQHAPFAVHIWRNETNLGYTRNFEKALSLCSCDIIFLSDQDDVWFEKKLEIVERVFTVELQTMVVLNDQQITDKFLRPTGNTIYSNTKSLGFDESWLSAGCCTAIRSEFRDFLIPFPFEIIAHDGWIHKLAVALKVRKIIPNVLQMYRRHSLNNSESMASTLTRSNIFMPLRKYGLKDVTVGWLNEIAICHLIIERLKNITKFPWGSNLIGVANAAVLTERRRIDFIYLRVNFLKKNRIRRIPDIVKFHRLGGYNYFSGIRSAIKDFVR